MIKQLLQQAAIHGAEQQAKQSLNELSIELLATTVESNVPKKEIENQLAIAAKNLIARMDDDEDAETKTVITKMVTLAKEALLASYRTKWQNEKLNNQS